MSANDENEAAQPPKLEPEIRAINTMIRKCLELNAKQDDKNLRNEIALCYLKRGCLKLDKYKNYVGSVYDLTISLQYNVTSLAFAKRGELFHKLEFYEQALADFRSSYDCSTNQKEKDVLLPRIIKLRETVNRMQN